MKEAAREVCLIPPKLKIPTHNMFECDAREHFALLLLSLEYKGGKEPARHEARFGDSRDSGSLRVFWDSHPC